MRVFDCFTFYNEFDLLELRLEELWNSVDYFVIAEANSTHQNNIKPFYLKDNWARFEKYSSKIRHIMIDDMPMNSNTWVNEKFQRTCLQRGLRDLSPEDLVITSDCDEIPRSTVIDAIKKESTVSRVMLYTTLHCFKFNYLMIKPTGLYANIMITRGDVYTNPQQEREYVFPWITKPAGLTQVNHGGWHFSYFGETEFAINKIKNFAHSETNRPEILDKINVAEMIKNKVGLLWSAGQERFEYAKLDNYYPKTVLNNLEKYKTMIVPDGTRSVYEFYPP